MKNRSFYSWGLLLLMALLSACDEEKVTFVGNEFVMFTDTVQYMPVTTDAERIFDVVISTTKAAKVDRNFAVELVVNKSNAIEGRHFDLVSNNVLIKAGELTGSVSVKGYYDNIIYGDSLAFTLRLLTAKDQVWDMYGKETNVSIIKCPPFSIDAFTGNLKMYASFPFNSAMVTFYVKGVKQDDSTLLIKEAFSSKWDLKVRFKNNNLNPFEDELTVPEQNAFTDITYGQVYTRSAESYSSFYLMETRSLGMYLDMFVPQIGTFGIHQYLFKWVPQSEVDAANNSTGTPFLMTKEAFDFKNITGN